MDPVSALGLGIGDILSMMLFLVDQRGSRRAAQDIQRELKNGNVIRDYLEWLRRQDHQALVAAIATSQDKLLQEIATLGTDICGFTELVRREVQTANRDLADRLDDLNRRFIPPMLSPAPLRARPLTAVPLLGRDCDLAWLHNCKGDAVVFGQPGCGKTYLLYHYGQQVGGRFLLTEEPNAAVQAVIAGCPSVIFIDDVASKTDLVLRLLHLRQEHGLKFKLVLVCWPFELDGLLFTTGLSRSITLELPLLGRQVIAEIVQSVVKDAGYIAPTSVIREINNQAAGRPGLAVALAIASLHEDLQRVMRGDTLLQFLGQFYGRVAGTKATPVLAAFAVGGKGGMDMEVVARSLSLSVLDVHAMAKSMAPGGVLETLSSTQLVARPSALRRAVLKEVFFNPTQPCLPRTTYETLLKACPDRDAALKALLDAAHVDALMDASWLRSLIAQSRDPKVWESYAALGRSHCEWILDKHPEHLAHIIDPALHYVPERIIPRVLDQAVGDRRALNARPEAPLRQLGDWVSHGRGGTPEAIRRRKDLFSATARWLQAGGDYSTALAAFGFCFRLGYEFTDTDAGDGMTVTFSSGLLTPAEAKEVETLWPLLLEVVKTRGILDWKPLLGIIYSWLRPHTNFGKDPGVEYEVVTKPVARRMIKDLVAICGGHNGFLRWVHTHADEAGLDSSTVPVSEEYMLLFPPERFTDGWKEEEKIHLRQAEQLAESWRSLSFAEIVSRLKRYESESSAMDRSWPRLTPIVCRIVAANRELTTEDMSAMMDVELAADLLEPFILRALETNVAMNDVLQHCLRHDRYRWMAIFHILTKPISSLMTAVEPMLGDYAHVIDHLGYRALLPEEVMDRLFRHDNPAVQLAAALCEFRSDRKRAVRSGLRSVWRVALLSGILAKDQIHDLRNIHDLQQIVAYDRSLAFDILSGMISRDPSSLSMWDVEPLLPLVAILTAEERRKLIDQCGSLLITDLVGVLVGDDADLFKHLLRNPSLHFHHLTPLVGDPNKASWAEKAIMALEAGYSAEKVSYAALGRHWGWSGRASTMWQGWVDSFKPLLAHADTRIQAIGQAGVNWSTANRDRELRNERYVDIHGRFDE